MSSNKPKKNPLPADADRCQFIASDGRRCAHFRAPGNDSFCRHHVRRAADDAEHFHRTPQAAALVAEILGPLNQLQTTTAANDALAKLFSLRARKLISLRETIGLAYIIQLLLQTLHGVKDEFMRIHSFSAWDQVIEKSLDTISPPEITQAVKNADARLRKRHRKAPRTGKEFAEQVFARVGIKLPAFDPRVPQPAEQDEDESAAENSSDDAPEDERASLEYVHPSPSE
jgi:hypothetical protein